MSLIDDALKRQEELSRKQAERPAPAPTPPPAPPPPAAPPAPVPTAEPPSRVSAPTPAPQPAPRPAPKPAPRPVRRPVPPPAGGAPFPRQTADSRQPSMGVLFMPLLGIVVLLILLFLRREFIPRQIENEELRIENFGADGDKEPDAQEQAPGGDAPAARPQTDEVENGALGESALPERVESEELKVKSDGEPDGDAPPDASAGRNAPAARPQADGEKGGALGESAPPEAAPPEVAIPAESAPLTESAKPEAGEPVAKAWPKFTLSGIAVGRERLAMLSTGEMLTAGEVSKCGVKVEKVESASVVFSWQGETKTLRKGEQSDKPADAPNASGNN